ncbi:MAG: DUF4268 domain-containing protein, partial [Flavobacteriaceae bacterium]|nr:DUF4268 domain-containing protein [Flavobacteriaceae bacterium]
MFSKEESKQLREEFWTSFGKSYPRKWILYNTKIKNLSLKFHFDRKIAMVCLDLEDDLDSRINRWDKLTQLKGILITEYLPTAVYEDSYFLSNGKEISRIFVSCVEQVSIHDKGSWGTVMRFLYD